MPVDVSSSSAPSIRRASDSAIKLTSLSLPRLLVSQITLETLVSFIVILLGVALTAAPLKNVTWASEMRTKYVSHSLSTNLISCELLTLAFFCSVVTTDR